jgi:hypothetical protein
LARDNRSRPVEGGAVTELHDRGGRDPFGGRPAGDAADAVVSAERDALIGAAAAVLGERDASLLDLHLRHGLSPAEIAEELGVAANTAHQQLFRLRDRLGSAIGCLLLWHRGTPECAELAALVDGRVEFDAETARLVERHQRSCSDCSDRRAAMTSPVELFSALPIVTVPVAVKLDILSAIQAAGVPLGEPPATLTLAATQSDQPSSGGPPVVAVTADGVPAGGDERSGRRRAGWLLVAAAVLVALVGTALVVGADDGPVAAPGPPADAPAATGTPRSGDPGADDLAGSGTEPATTPPAAPTTAAPPPATAPPVTVPPPVVPPAVATTAPRPQATSPPPPPPTAPPPPSPTAPSTTAPAPPPRIVSFSVAGAPGTLICPAGTPRRFTWSTTLATSVTLTIAGSTRVVPASGSLDTCGSAGATATLVATSPGGSVQRSLTL